MFFKKAYYMFMGAWAFLKRMNTVPLIVELQLGREGGLDFHFILSVVLQFYNKNVFGKGETLDFS